MNNIHVPSPLSFPRASIIYLLGAALGTGLLVGSACLDRKLGTGELFSILVRLLLSIVLLGFFRIYGGLGQLTEGNFLSKYLPLLLLFPAFSLVMHTGPLGGTLPFGEAALWILALLTEVVWEELFFRHTALLLYGRKELFSARTVIFTGLIFGAVHLVHIPSVSMSYILPDAALSLCMAVFLTALYLRTKNIFVPMTTHFLMRFSSGLFPLADGVPESLHSGVLPAVFCGALLLVIGGILLVRGRRAEAQAEAGSVPER